MAINIRETIIENLQKVIDKNDYMSLVAVQLRIKTEYYINPDVNGLEKAKADIKFLTQYKKSYPHIASEIDEVVEYLSSIITMESISGVN